MAGVSISINQAALSSALEQACKPTLATIADDILSDMQRLVPVRTGVLRSSLFSEVVKGGIECGAEADYANFVEYGTRKMMSQPFIRPSVLQNRGTFHA